MSSTNNASYADAAMGQFSSNKGCSEDSWTNIKSRKDKRAEQKQAKSMIVTPTKVHNYELDSADDFPQLEYHSDDSVTCEKVLTPRDVFLQKTKVKLEGKSFASNSKRVEGPLEPGTMVVSIYEKNLQSSLNGLPESYFNVEFAMKKGVHGLKLNPSNCPDVDNYIRLKGKRKVDENAIAVVKKAARLVCAMDPTWRKKVVTLAQPGGTFALLLDKDHVDIILDHYRATNESNSLLQYSLVLKKYLFAIWNCYKEDCIKQMKPMTPIQIESKLARIASFCNTTFSAAKKDNRVKKFIAQELGRKKDNEGIADVHVFQFMENRSLEFLKDASKAFLPLFQKNKGSKNIDLFMTEHGNLNKALQTFMFAIRNSFMFNTPAQRTGQYANIRKEEFFLIMSELQQDGSWKEAAKECLAYGDMQAQHRCNDMRSYALQNSNQYCLCIKRIPLDPDKKMRNKDSAWVQWKLHPNMLKSVCGYFYHVLPLLAQIAKGKNVPFETDKVFHHSVTLKALTGKACISLKCKFWNFHAVRNNMELIKQTESGNLWRHTYCTSELDRFQKKEAYKNCNSVSDAALAISNDMNTSVEEVMKTYSTRIVIGGVTFNDKSPKAFQWEDSDDDLFAPVDAQGQSSPVARVAKTGAAKSLLTAFAGACSQTASVPGRSSVGDLEDSDSEDDVPLARWQKRRTLKRKRNIVVLDTDDDNIDEGGRKR